ncbi:hypothetical protein CLCR_07547 [Cladophialophora carrionii]|uniref:Uncharacterized protein n=1 Tax=Cladophialophora carrionii TaxID=86049 RepID=A0A1C1CPD3_9EURO|nr:hypothetical protein CLCR_07547 [Cladophialophora carrionii]
MDASQRDANQDVHGAQVNGQELSSHDSTSYLPQQGSTLDRGDRKFHPAASVLGPTHGLSTDQQTLTTGYRIGDSWIATQPQGIHTSLVTPENHGQRERGWKDFAQGGFHAADERLQNIITPSIPHLPGSGLESEGIFQIPPIRRDAVKVLSNGRTSVWQEYQPAPMYNQGFPCNTARRDPGYPTGLGGGGLSNPGCMDRKQCLEKAAGGLIVETPAQVPLNSSATEPDMNAGDSAMEDQRDLNDYFRTF